MPFARPTVADLIARIASDMESRLPGSAAQLRRSVLHVLSRAEAGAVHGLYGRLDYLADQIMPDTAAAEELARWASIWGVSRAAATKASGPVEFTGSDGVTIPAGSELQTADGLSYITDADATVQAGTVQVDVTAILPGSAGNHSAGVTLSLISPIAGVESQAAVVSPGLTGGADTEDDNSLRARLLLRIQRPPHGGSDDDYERWALEVAGISRAFVFPLHLGEGTVGVAVLADDLDPPIPGPAKVQETQEYIDELRPVTAAVTVYAPTAVALDLTIALTPNTAAVRDAVTAQLRDLLRREGIPGGTILLSHIREAISLAAGETDHSLVSPVADITHTTGEIAVLGAITWQ